MFTLQEFLHGYAIELAVALAVALTMWLLKNTPWRELPRYVREVWQAPAADMSRHRPGSAAWWAALVQTGLADLLFIAIGSAALAVWYQTGGTITPVALAWEAGLLGWAYVMRHWVLRLP